MDTSRIELLALSTTGADGRSFATLLPLLAFFAFGALP